MNETARKVIPEVVARVVAALLPQVLWLVDLPLGPTLLLGLLLGFGGYFLGGKLARLAIRAAAQARLSPAGRLAYQFVSLPPSEVGKAGGKAQSLARLAQAGFPVPAGLVLLPTAFDGDELSAPGREALRAELARLGAGPFAVRSSALGEDSASASFAGAFESELGVQQGQVFEAVGRVRSSRHANRVSDYAATRGVAAGEMAVIVQELVPAELAGVLFTADPLTGDLDRMHGSLVRGLGESLVSGESDGVPFTLHRPDGTFEGPDELAPKAARLHSLAHNIEGLFDGLAQDIEWALAEGRIQILQARPITTMTTWKPDTAERNDSLAGTCLWSATNLSEANPEAQTPLTISWSSFQQDHGGPSMKVRGREMAGYLGGRPFANLSVQLSAQGPKVQADPRAAYRKLAPLWGALPEAVPIPLLPVSRADWREEGPRLLGTLLQLFRHRLGVNHFLATSAEACQQLSSRVDGCQGPAELLRLWQGELFPGSLRAFWAVIAATSDRADPVEAELNGLVGAADAAVLLANVAGLAGGLESLGPAAGLQQVLTGSLPRLEYLQRFGHRGYNEIELAWPRPMEDPEWLDRALASAAQTDLAAQQQRQREAFVAALARLRAAHPKQAAGLERRLKRRAERAARRERVRSESVRWTGVTRHFALRAGELLGVGDDVFLLTMPELLTALAGNHSAFSHFEVRRQSLRRYRALPPLPSFIVGRFDPFEWAQQPTRRTDFWVAGSGSRPATDDDATIRGVPASSGTAEGTVRVLGRIEDADQLQSGEVLVTSLTNIGWTPIFPRAAAIVTDIGAPLSHAAIVARELGIPAVVGCGDATSRLTTGDRVRVDGVNGTVEVLSVRSTVAAFDQANEVR